MCGGGGGKGAPPKKSKGSWATIPPKGGMVLLTQLPAAAAELKLLHLIFGSRRALT